MTKIVTTVADPKENVRQKPHTSGVGDERHADMSVVGESGLKAGVEHLERDLAEGSPHMPLHGLRPTKRG